MTEPTTHEELTRLLREFMAGMREHISAKVKDADAETLIERVLGGLSAVVAAVLAMFPSSRRRDALVGSLMAAAVRYLARRQPPPAGD